jgi:hypothetical protein
MLEIGELPVEVVIVAVSDRMRTYYTDDGKRLCHSKTGIAPSEASKKPQAKKCAICFFDQWGSKITPNGKRGKGCAEFIQLVLRQPDTPENAVSLRVPAASMKIFRDYEKQVNSRGEKLRHVVTRIGATHEATRSTLTFRVVRFLEAEELDTLKQASARAVSPFAATDGYTN